MTDTVASTAPSRAERALRASFYLNTVPTLSGIVGELKGVVVDALERSAPPLTRVFLRAAKR